MDFSRRRFLQASTMAAAASMLPNVGRSEIVPASIPMGSLPILQAATDATSAVFVILHPNVLPLRLKILAADGRELPYTVAERTDVAGAASVLTEILVDGLSAAETYRLQVLDEAGLVQDERFFSSLDLSRKSARFAVVSCMAANYQRESITMWRTVAEQRPDFVIFLGDTCYADVDNPDRSSLTYGRRYAETRSRLWWFRQKRLVPSLATWDDHDFGVNNGNRTFPGGESNRGLFRRFWGTRFNGVTRRGFGVGSVFEAFGQRFFLMDDRSFRDPRGQRLGRHWGEDQTEWLIEEVQSSPDPAWLMNGSQFFGGYLEKESFESDHRGDFDDVLAKLSRLEAPVCFVSGDVHFSETMRIEPRKLGYATHEFTSSSIHSTSYPFAQWRAWNTRREHSEWRHNFLMFETSLENGPPAGADTGGGGRDIWNSRVRCLLEYGRVSFEQTVSIQRG